MGVFDDKKFDNLDWISQTTEPIDSHLNEVLNKVPDELLIDFDLYNAMLEDSYHLELSLDKVVTFLAGKYAGKLLSWSEINTLTKCFEFSLEGDVAINFEQKKINGDFKLIKIVSTIDEKDLNVILGQDGTGTVAHTLISEQNSSRANEIMELLEKCEDGIRSRSARTKKSVLYKRLVDLFKTNEWNIRDTELANKVGRWIAEYLQTGNLASFSNFCRLKVMTHKNQPIYSMEEVR